jgi:hypothetical protein
VINQVSTCLSLPHPTINTDITISRYQFVSSQYSSGMRHLSYDHAALAHFYRFHF